MKRLTAMILVLLTLFSVIPAGVFANETADTAEISPVENLTAFKNVPYVTSETQTLGADNNEGMRTISTDDGDTVTKAQWIAEIVELFSLEMNSSETADDYYPDVTKEHEYFKEIIIATTHGLIDTPASENFNPDSPASREFVAHTANELLGYQIVQETETVVYSFSDSAGAVYPRDLQTAVDRGWFALSGTNVNPSQAVTAAEAAKVSDDIKATIEREQVSEENISNVTFKDGVKLIDIYSNVIEVEMGHLQFTDLDTNTLSVGDTVAVFVGPIPSIVKVESITTEGLVTDVKGQALSLEEGVDMKSLHLEGTSEISLESFRAGEGEDVVYVFEDGVETSSATFARARALKDRVKVKNITIPRIEKKIIDGVTAAMTAGTKSVVFEYKITWDTVHIEVNGNVYGTLEFGIDANKLMGAEKSILIGTVAVPGVGPINLYAVVTLDGKLVFTFNSGFESTVSNESGFLRVNTKLKNPEGYVEAEINAKVGLKVEYKLELLSLIKGNVWAEGGVKAGYKLRTRTDSEREQKKSNVKVCEGFETYVYAQVGYSLKVGYAELEKIGIKSYSKSDTYDIITKDDKVGYQLYHWEDGIARLNCAFEDFSKYFTKYGGSNGFIFPSWKSNRGYGSGGQIIQVFEYSLDDSGFATITGFNYTTSLMNIPSEIDGHKVVGIADGVFRGKKNIQVIKLPEGVKEIGEDAFSGCTSLYSVQFPSTLTYIRAYAFYGCTSLTYVDLPDKLEKMGQYSFGNCTSLSVVQIPKSLKEVYMNAGQGGAFAGCSALRTVKFEEGITHIAQYLFGKSGLREITIPDTVKTIDSHAFIGCKNLQTVNFGSGLTDIDSHAFSDCTSLGEVKFPSTLTTIAENAFSDCTGLYSIEFNENLTYIGRYAFWKCSALTEITLPKSLKKFGQYSFGYCESLEEVFIPKSIEDTLFNAGSGGPFSNCAALDTVKFEEGITNIPERLFAECTGLTEITIPEGVTTIKYQAFGKCTNLTKINFPESLTTIDENAFRENTKLKEVTFPSKLTEIEESAFDACPILEKVVFNEGLTHIGRYAFYRCGELKEAKLPKSIRNLGQYAFGECDKLENIFIPKNIQSVLFYAGSGGPFSGASGIKNVEFEEGIEYIPERLFAECDGLTTLTIPDTVREIRDYAFQKCINLTGITLSKNTEKIGSSAFSECTKLEKLSIPAKVTSIGDSAFFRCNVLREVTFEGNLITEFKNTLFMESGLEKINIPEGVSVIGEYAFSKCAKLTDVTFPASLTEIEGNAFNECVLLSDFTLPENLEKIDYNAFIGCSSLTKVIIPDSVMDLGGYAFANCSKLESIAFPDYITDIPYSVAAGCSELRSVTFGRSALGIQREAFMNCPKLDNVVLPIGMVAIKENAFKNCTGLKTITIPQTVTEIKSTAFSYPMTVYGPKGSFVENWAKENGHTFVDNTNHIIGIAPVDKEGNIIEVLTVYRGENFLPDYMVIAADDTKEPTDSLSYTLETTAVYMNNGRLYANRAGDVKVTVTPVGSDGNATTGSAEYTIRVIELSSVKVTAPTKTTYNFGEELDLSGMVVEAVYSDGSTKVVSDYEVTGYNKDSYGKQTITVRYSGKEAVFDVTVVDDRVLVTAISVTKMPDKTQYLIKEKFDAAGIEITAELSDGTKADVTANVKYSPLNILQEGEKTVTVTYTGENVEGGSVITTEFKVNYYKELPTQDDAKVAEIISAIDTFCVADLTLTDAEKIMGIKSEYDALSDENRAKVTNYLKLEDAVERLSQLAKAAETERKINEVYERFYINPAGVTEDEVRVIESEYNSLADEFRRKVSNYELLGVMTAYFDGLAEAIISDINDLYGLYKENSPFWDEYEVQSVKAVYDTLSVQSKKLVTNYNLLEQMLLGEPVKPEVPDVLKGDVNGDKKINALDATQILRFANNKSSVLAGCVKGDAKFTSADVNGDGKINALDATQILRYANNKSSVLSK